MTADDFAGELEELIGAALAHGVVPSDVATELRLCVQVLRATADIVEATIPHVPRYAAPAGGAAGVP